MGNGDDARNLRHGCNAYWPGLDSDGARIGRLFFQPVLVAWALWATNGLDALPGRAGRSPVEQMAVAGGGLQDRSA